MSSIEKKIQESPNQKSRITGNIVLDEIDEFVHTRNMNEYPKMGMAKTSNRCSTRGSSVGSDKSNKHRPNFHLETDDGELRSS